MQLYVRFIDVSTNKLPHTSTPQILLFNYACTRGSNKLHLKRPNTNFYRTTFEYMGAQLFNSLPEEIRAVKSYTNFKKALQTIDHQFLYITLTVSVSITLTCVLIPLYCVMWLCR